MTEHPEFSIITPSFRSSKWLKLCIASVADQHGVTWEHIIQDACSDDETRDWLPNDPRVKAFIEKDYGMYDAVNRGLRRAQGSYLAYVNADEQYLPGALSAVRDLFLQRPEIDLVFGDAVIVDANGNYRFHRKVLRPTLAHTSVGHLATLSCATFFRRALVDDHHLLFDASLRDVGDGEWMIRALKRGVRMAVLRQFTSVFTDTGANMSTKANAMREKGVLAGTAPAWMRVAKPAIIGLHRVRRLFGGIYHQNPFTFELYTLRSPEKRIQIDVSKPTFRWRLDGEQR